MYSKDGGDWEDTTECVQLAETECDLTHYLRPFDRTFVADIKTEPVNPDYDHDPEDFPHTYSPPFNPYKESNISAAEFQIHPVDDHRVIVNITDPLTGLHERGKQFSIRDVLKKDLKYKVSYYKSGSTGKRDNISDSSEAEVSKLDAGQSYCFMVAAFIPSRPKASQLGALSPQQCTKSDPLQELNVGAWVGAAFILIIILIIIVTVTVLCCQQRKNNLNQTSQRSEPV